jgi:hypothetical protein
MSWKLSAIVLSPGGDIVESQHPKRFFSSSSATSTSGGVAGQTPAANGVPAASDQVHDQGDEEGSEVRISDTVFSSLWTSTWTLCLVNPFYHGQNMSILDAISVSCQVYRAVIPFYLSCKRRTIRLMSQKL